MHYDPVIFWCHEFHPVMFYLLDGKLVPPIPSSISWLLTHLC